MDDRYQTIAEAIDESIQELITYGDEVDTGHWQGVPTEGKPDLVTVELMGLSWSALMPASVEEAQIATRCNMPWAEDHFRERVARRPTNPGFEYKNWPWWHGQSDKAMEVREDPPGVFTPLFTHTYQERFWPKSAGNISVLDEQNLGIRYPYGDLDDVVKLLKKNPYTRQATFPIFFPEDTGAAHGGRVPCTLHYHFLMRGDFLHMWYPIRSCDAVRHFRDDVYMAIRLCQWVLDELNWSKVKPGFLHFSAYSFHVHKGDLHWLTG